MSNSKHTPGPWQFKEIISPKLTMYEVRDTLGNDVVRLDYEIGDENDGLPSDVEKQANARLIAAAPECLAQLIACRKFLLSYMDGDLVSYDRAKDDDTWPHLLLRDIERLIAKATGNLE